MKSNIILSVFILLGAHFSFAQAPPIQWAKCFGGSSLDEAHSIQQTIDSDYIIAGYTASTDGDVTGQHGGPSDSWIVKLDKSGNLKWEKSLGGSGSEFAYSIVQTTDDGYAFTGFTNSDDGDVTGYHHGLGYPDVWVVKLNSIGMIEWQKCLGGTNEDVGNCIRQTFDGGYIVAGYSRSTDGDVTGHHGSSSHADYWVIKLDALGNLEWQRSLGGSDLDEAQSIAQMADCGYIVAGYTRSSDGEVKEHHGGQNRNDVWIARLNKEGNFQFGEVLPGKAADVARGICIGKDGNIVVVGHSSSSYNQHQVYNHGPTDFLLAKLNRHGKLKAISLLGGSLYEYGRDINSTVDGGYIITGDGTSDDGDVSGTHGSFEYWVVKVDSNMNIQWQECLGGSEDERANSIHQTFDGGYIVAGFTTTLSNSGQVVGNHGQEDYWIVKLAPDQLPEKPVSKTIDNSSFVFSIFPNPAFNQFTINYVASSNASFELSDLFGRVVMSKQIQTGSGSISFDVAILPKGIYLVKMIAGNLVRSKKVEIVH